MGQKIFEIGCVELVTRLLTWRHYNLYINPQREVEAGAIEVHGITNAMLAGKPVFAQIAEDFLAFVEGAELVIHNAPFDLGFLNHELRAINPASAPLTDLCPVVDTLVIKCRRALDQTGPGCGHLPSVHEPTETRGIGHHRLSSSRRMSAGMLGRCATLAPHGVAPNSDRPA
jgi:DNA polymerase III epsilon subunit-like protein